MTRRSEPPTGSSNATPFDHVLLHLLVLFLGEACGFVEQLAAQSSLLTSSRRPSRGFMVDPAPLATLRYPRDPTRAAHPAC